MKTIFVTGTGTGVGKTRVCGLLLGFLRRQGIDAVYQKWVATGPASPPSDLSECLRLAGIRGKQHREAASVIYHFPLPVSPHLAARQVNRVVDPENIRQKYAETAKKHEIVIVEGAGGILVPLNENLLLADLVAELKPPTLIVAKSGLGTINHSLLTLEALRRRGIPVLGLVFSDSRENEDELVADDNGRIIASKGETRVLGRLRRCPGLIRARADFALAGLAISEAMGIGRAQDFSS